MNFLKSSLCAATAVLAFALPAYADNTGLPVTGTLAFGPNGANGANGGQFWSPQNTVIGPGIEYSYVDGANRDTADFGATQLTIRDQVFSNANGWEMTFATAGGFSALALVSSDFVPGLTFNLNAGKIVVDWLGTGSAPHDFTAVFDVTGAAPVPEPETYALMMAGLAAGAAFARRRKQTR